MKNKLGVALALGLLFLAICTAPTSVVAGQQICQPVGCMDTPSQPVETAPVAATIRSEELGQQLKAREQTRAADQRLKDQVIALRGSLSRHEYRRFAKAQGAWEKYRRATCGYQSSHLRNKQSRNNAIYDCRTQMANDRSAELGFKGACKADECALVSGPR